MELDLEVVAGFDEGSMGGIGDDPTDVSVDKQERYSSGHPHFRFLYAALEESLLARTQARHDDRLRTTTGGDTRAIGRGIEQRQNLIQVSQHTRRLPGDHYHSHDFGLHLPNTREHIRVDGVGNTKLSEGFRLQLQQVLSTVIDSTTDTTILPARMFHVRQLVELSANLFSGPSFLRKIQITINAGPRRDEFRFKILNSCGNLLINLATDAREPQEDGITEETDGGVGIADAAEDAITAQRIECLANVAKDKEDKNDISKTGCPVIVRLAWSSQENKTNV